MMLQVYNRKHGPKRDEKIYKLDFLINSNYYMELLPLLGHKT